MRNIYEIYSPILDVNVRYKVLPPEDVESFIMMQLDCTPMEFAQKVLEHMIYNLRPEVTNALKAIPTEKARGIIASLYNGCVMLNPGLDVDKWNSIAAAEMLFPDPSDFRVESAKSDESEQAVSKNVVKKLNKVKLLKIEEQLKHNIVGQDEAINEVMLMLTRNIVGLGEENRPLGVFMFTGGTGVGKTLLAKELHKSIFGEKTDIVRVDCGEYQHKHENQKLLGSPNGYVAHDEGGQLTNALLKQPDTVLLLDEVEKAHPDIWNTFLTAFDEGYITDGRGKKISLKNVIIIMTTNLGNQKIVDRMTNSNIGFGKGTVGFVEDRDARQLKRSEIESLSKEAIRKQFKPEFLNRVDKIVVFNHLTAEHMQKIAELELEMLKKKLSKRDFLLTYSSSTVIKLAEEGKNPVQGARSIGRYRRDTLENMLAKILIEKHYPKKTTFSIGYDEVFKIDVIAPTKELAIP